MVSIVESTTTNIVQKLVDRITNEAYYLCCFKKITKDYEEEKKDLVAKQGDVQKDIEENKNAVKEIVGEVKLWMHSANALIKEDTSAKKSCFFGWCHNCIWQYQRGKDLYEKTQKIKAFVEKNFEKIGRSAKLPDIEYHSLSNFMSFHSRESIYDKILNELKNGKGYIIALQGLGGSGKTTLAIKVGEKVQEEKIYDRVILVTVSINPEDKKIQDQIAQPLGVKFDQEENDLERAKKLRSRLTNGEKILIVLDDVWEPFKFDKIGIPFEHNHSNCRLLLTTRDLDVCKQMDCQAGSTIQLGILSKNEAWIFFQKFSGIKDNSSKKLKGVAKEIAIECGGLPVALAAVARTLKDQPPKDWEAALRSLKNPRPVDIVDRELKEVYQSLKVSFDFLKNEPAQKIFKLCSLFPEDHEIPLEDLTMFAIGLGLFGEIDSYTIARDDMHRAKKRLLESGLLMEVDQGKCVKMHDLIRDVAKVIANNEIQLIAGPEWNLGSFEKQIDMRYLYCQNMIDFPKQLPCPNLEILIVSIDGRDFLEVPEAFFKEIINLKVLVLQYRRQWTKAILKLPQSIELLKGLHTLSLIYLKFEEISILTKLHQLETLELIGCMINELPNGMTELDKLRLLKLEGCGIERNPLEVIGKLSKIEELYFVGNFGSSWDFTREHVAGLFNKRAISQKLQRYRISLEWAPQAFYCFRIEDSISKGVGIEQFLSDSISNATIKNLMQGAEYLGLKKIQNGYRCVIPSLVEAIGGDMNELNQLVIGSYSGMECLIDTTGLQSLTETTFSKLIELQLEEIHDLKELCKGLQIPPNLFEELKLLNVQRCKNLEGTLLAKYLNLRRLEQLSVRDCPMLTSLFTFSTAQSLVELKQLQIIECKELKYLTTEDRVEGEEIVQDQKEDQLLFPILDEMILGKLPNLISIFLESHCLMFSSQKRLSIDSSPKARVHDNTTSLGLLISNSEQLGSEKCLLRHSWALSRVRVMKIYECPKLKSLFTPSVASILVLEELIIWNCDGMKQIITDGGDYQNHNHNNTFIFPKLKSVEVYGCSILEFIFPAIFSGNLLHLKSIDISEAPELKYLFGQYCHDNNSSHLKNNLEIQIDLLALEDLDLDDLPKIIGICPNNFHMVWPLLKTFSLDKCPLLRITTISDLMAHYDIRQLKNITGMSLQNLRHLDIRGCDKLKTVFSVAILRCLPQLLVLHIQDCKELEQLIEEDNDNQNLSNSQSQLTFLPKLIGIIVVKCPKLKRLFKCNKVPKLELLLIKGASQLEEVFGCEQWEITEPKMSEIFPKLKYLILMKLSTITKIGQGINVPYIVVCDCPKLDLPSTTTLEDLLVHELAIEGNTIITFPYIIYTLNQSDEASSDLSSGLESEDVTTSEEDLTISECEQPISQSQVAEEPVDNAPKISISEKSTTLDLSTDFNPQNSTTKSLVFPTAYPEATKSSRKPTMATTLSPSLGNSSILLQDTTSLSIKENFEGELKEKDELVTSSSHLEPKVTKEIGKGILQNLPTLDKPAMATSNEVTEATVVTSSIDSKASKPSAESLVLPQILASETTALIESKPNCTDAKAILKSKHTQAEISVTQENMEAFYASIEADSSTLPLAENTNTNIGSDIIRPSEETKKALQILQDLVSKKFSLLLHPGRTGFMKNVLDYLLSLSPEDGISLRMKFVIMQLSRSFRQWSLDYNDASLKLELAIANQSSIMKLEEGLAANVEEFKEAAMLENEASSKLANLEAKKRELEDQINAIKEEIVDCKLARDSAAERKRQAFESGRMLKSKKDDLTNRVPNLRDEQEWAKITQESIEYEWSKLSQQFIECSNIGE